MKKAVGQKLKLQIVKRFTFHQAQKMVPLQNLMQKDPIEKPSQGEP
jgi:hypothetical protein